MITPLLLTLLLGAPAKEPPAAPAAPAVSSILDEKALNTLLGDLDRALTSMEILNFDPNDAAKRQAYWSDEQDAQLAGSRALLDPLLAKRLEAPDPGHGTLALLSRFPQPALLPRLQALYLSEDFFYGWETTYPSFLDDMCFPSHYGLELAITAASGKKLTEVVTLDDAAAQGLLALKREASWYAVWRLRPELLKDALFSAFRDRANVDFRPFAPSMLAWPILNQKMLAGMNKDQIKAALGEPDKVEGDLWTWVLLEEDMPTARLIVKVGRKGFVEASGAWGEE